MKGGDGILSETHSDDATVCVPRGESSFIAVAVSRGRFQVSANVFVLEMEKRRRWMVVGWHHKREDVHRKCSRWHYETHLLW